MLIQRLSPHRIIQWIRANFPSTPDKIHPMDTYRNFLVENGASGETFYDKEAEFLAANGYTLGSLSERWDAYMDSLYTFPVPETRADRIREFFSKIFAIGNSYYLQEDGTSKYVTEDGSGYYILE